MFSDVGEGNRFRSLKYLNDFIVGAALDNVMWMFRSNAVPCSTKNKMFNV